MNQCRNTSRKRDSVSVVVPCYNAAEFLLEALTSALEQTVVPDEILVVDDGSTDESARIAASLGQPVKVMRQENQGESVARNRGIEAAKGEWVAFLDADDKWDPTKIERQLDCADNRAVLVHTGYAWFGDRAGAIRGNEVPDHLRYRLEYLAVHNPIGSPSCVVVRKAAKTRFPTWTRYGEDLVYYLNLLTEGEFRLAEGALTNIRVHRQSQSSCVESEVLWHRTVEEWISRHDYKLTAEQVAKVRTGWVNRVVKTARTAKYNRNWKVYWALREHLGSYRQYPEVQALLSEQIFPAWVYAVKDRFARDQVRNWS